MTAPGSPGRGQDPYACGVAHYSRLSKIVIDVPAADHDRELAFWSGATGQPLIPHVLADLAAMNPGVLIPAHCTGWRAQHAMSAQFPAAFVPNTVGTSFHL